MSSSAQLSIDIPFTAATSRQPERGSDLFEDCFAFPSFEGVLATTVVSALHGIYSDPFPWSPFDAVYPSPPPPYLTPNITPVLPSFEEYSDSMDPGDQSFWMSEANKQAHFQYGNIPLFQPGSWELCDTAGQPIPPPDSAPIGYESVPLLQSTSSDTRYGAQPSQSPISTAPRRDSKSVPPFQTPTSQGFVNGPTHYNTTQAPVGHSQSIPIHFDTTSVPAGHGRPIPVQFNTTAVPIDRRQSIPSQFNAAPLPPTADHPPCLPSTWRLPSPSPRQSKPSPSALRAVEDSFEENPSAPKRFLCPLPDCDRTFTRNYNLQAHLLTHKQHKPFVCSDPQCAKAFSRRHDLTRHRASAHGQESEKPFGCAKCGHRFVRRDTLRKHKCGV